MVVYFTLMYKTLGEFSWNGFTLGSNTEKCSIPTVPDNIIPDDQSIKKSAQQFHLAFENLKSVIKLASTFVISFIYFPFLFIVGIYYGSIPWIIWIWYMVVLFSILCHNCRGNGLSLVLY